MNTITYRQFIRTNGHLWPGSPRKKKKLYYIRWRNRSRNSKLISIEAIESEFKSRSFIETYTWVQYFSDLVANAFGIPADLLSSDMPKKFNKVYRRGRVEVDGKVYEWTLRQHQNYIAVHHNAKEIFQHKPPAVLNIDGFACKEQMEPVIKKWVEDEKAGMHGQHIVYNKNVPAPDEFYPDTEYPEI